MHLKSPSMWCLLRMEDLFGLSPQLGPLDVGSVSVEELLDGHHAWIDEIARAVEAVHRGRTAVPAREQPR
jgi:hypothetical protein